MVCVCERIAIDANINSRSRVLLDCFLFSFLGSSLASSTTYLWLCYNTRANKELLTITSNCHQLFFRNFLLVHLLLPSRNNETAKPYCICVEMLPICIRLRIASYHLNDLSCTLRNHFSHFSHLYERQEYGSFVLYISGGDL